MCNVWDAALFVTNHLKKHGYEAYIVGGAVRDHLLKRAIADVDVVTSAKANTVETLFNKTFRMNNEHETVIVRARGEQIEVTTMRGETIEEDLTKRDLTINSIAYNEDGHFINPTSGIDDLHNKILRSFVARERMEEDPLRMLRVYRFMSELGFSVDDELTETIKEKKHLIKNVAVERIVKEWQKLIKGTFRNDALKHMEQTELYIFIPQLQLKKETITRLRALPTLHNESDSFSWFLFCLCQQWKDPSPLKKMAISNDLMRDVRQRLRFFEERKGKKWNETMLFDASLNVALDVEKGRRFFHLDGEDEQSLIQKWEALPIKSSRELAINGNDLLDGSRTAGPWIKEELLWLERAVLTGKVKNKKEDLLRAIERRRKESEKGASKNF